MNSNALVLLPARARQVLYVLYGLIALAAAATHVGYSALNRADPPWLTVTAAVVSFLAVPVGAIAALNVTTGPAETPLLDIRDLKRQERADQLAAAVERKVIPNVPRDADGDGHDDTTGQFVKGHQ